MSLEPIWDFFFLSIHHFCLKCRGMLDTSTIIVCSTTKKKKAGTLCKKWKNLALYLSWVWRYSIVCTHPSVFNSHTAPYVHHKILMWGNNAGSVQTSQGSYYSSASTVLLLCIKHIFYCPPSDNMSVINCRSNAFCCCWYCPSFSVLFKARRYVGHVWNATI